MPTRLARFCRDLLNDVHLIKLMSTRLLADTVRVGAMGPAMLILVLIYDWRMTLFALIVLPLMGYPVLRLGKRLRKAATRSQEQTATAANQLKESVSGAKVIQAFSMEEIAVGRFRETLAQLFNVDLAGEPGRVRLGTYRRAGGGDCRQHPLLRRGPGNRGRSHQPRELHRRARRPRLSLHVRPSPQPNQRRGPTGPIGCQQGLYNDGLAPRNR